MQNDYNFIMYDPRFDKIHNNSFNSSLKIFFQWAAKTFTIETQNQDDGQDNQDVDHSTFQTSTLEHKRKEITKQIMQETGLKGQEYRDYIARKVFKNSQKSVQSTINSQNKYVCQYLQEKWYISGKLMKSQRIDQQQKNIDQRQLSLNMAIVIEQNDNIKSYYIQIKYYLQETLICVLQQNLQNFVLYM
ncbi:hypothetical protein pb186bvf_002852 [Paramecium bursaria]